jgi:CRISPR-associated exonuclease Cas4
MYIALALLLVLLAFIVLWSADRQRSNLGLPEGRVVYTDTGAERRLEQPLFDEDLQLVGKPDYLIENSGGLVPVEVKSGRTPRKPHDSHIHQLAAYCLLVARNFRKRPAYGIIRYPQRSFKVEFTRNLEKQLLALLDGMHESLFVPELHRSHEVLARCAACGYRQLCAERLRA